MNHHTILVGIQGCNISLYNSSLADINTIAKNVAISVYNGKANTIGYLKYMRISEMICSMNHIHQQDSSKGSVQNMINMFVHKSKKEVIIVTNIAVGMGQSSDLKCNLLSIFGNIKFLKISSASHLITIIMILRVL